MNCRCIVKGNSPMVARLEQEAKRHYLSQQSPQVQAWAYAQTKRYEEDKAKAKTELAEIGKEVANAEVKFASKAQRRALIVQPQIKQLLKPKVVRIVSKQARRIQPDSNTEGVEIFRHRFRAIKNLLWEMGWNNTYIPRWYKFFGEFKDSLNDKVVARDIAFMKQATYEMGLNC